MKRLAFALLIVAAGCGPRISDKDKPSFNNGTTDNNGTTGTSGNNGTSGGNNGTTSNNNGTVVGNNGTAGNNGTTVGNNGTTSNNNGTTPNNNGTTGNNNGTTSNNNTNNMVDPIAEKCAAACDVLWGRCVDTFCNLPSDVAAAVEEIELGCKGTGGDRNELCTARYAAEPDYRTIVDSLAANPSCNNEYALNARCLNIGSDVCSGCPQPVLGTPCTQDSQCDGGLLPGLCQPEAADGTWDGGYCLAGGCDFGNNGAGALVVGAGTGCGEDGVCYAVDTQSSVCFERCFDNRDCERYVTGPNQSGYSCVAAGEIDDGTGTLEYLGVCQPACSDALPCDDGFVCGNTQACEVTCVDDFECPQSFSCTGTVGDQSYCEYTG